MSWKRAPLPCTLNGIVIHVDEVSDQEAASLAMHHYPHSDGADIEHLGADASQIAIMGSVSGSSWVEDIDALRTIVATSTPATFVHPQRGTLTGFLRQLRITARESEHDIARLQIEFVVQRPTPAAFAPVTTTTSAAAAVRTAGASATAAAAALGA